jgi:hypothetical protein
LDCLTVTPHPRPRLGLLISWLETISHPAALRLDAWNQAALSPGYLGLAATE